MRLTIDPGLSASPGGTGWCISKEGILLPRKTGYIAPKGNTWEKRAFYVTYQMLRIMSEEFPLESKRLVTDVYIELPAFFQSAKGMSCATGNTGEDSSLVKLSVLIGQLSCIFCVANYRSVNFLRVNEWKNTLSKEAVELRVAKRLNINESKLPFKSHVIDAVGMSLHLEGVFAANEGKSKTKAVVNKPISNK